MKTTLILCALSLMVSCSTITKISQATTEISSGASSLENSTNSIDRAVASGQRIKETVKNKK